MEIEIGVVPQASVVRCLTVMRNCMEMQLLSELKCFHDMWLLERGVQYVDSC